MSDVLGSVAAWGWVRTEFMTAAHADEHEEIYDLLVRVPATVVEFAGCAVDHGLERLLAHIELEEKTFPNADGARTPNQPFCEEEHQPRANVRWRGPPRYTRRLRRFTGEWRP